MPRSFLLTNRRYIPTPPPADLVNDDDNNNNNDDNHHGYDLDPSSQHISQDCTAVSMSESRPRVLSVSPATLSSELMVAQILISQAEQTEAVNLAMAKPSRDDTTTARTSTVVPVDNGSVVVIRNDGVNFGEGPDTFDTVPAGQVVPVSDIVHHDRRYYSASSPDLRPTVIYSVSSSSSSSNHNSNSNNNNSASSFSGNYSSSVEVSHSHGHGNGAVGMDLSMKADPRSPPPPHASSSSISSSNNSTLTAPAEHEAQDRSPLSDGDSDSGCSTQNEARSHLGPDMDYGWAECHAHFSLLYDLMTQGGRKLPGKESEGYAGKEGATEPSAPYDYSQTPTRGEPVPEPPVLYELMTESPRKASGRDVPDHAMEVEVSMQQYPTPPHATPPALHQAQSYHSQQQPGGVQQQPHHNPYHPQQQQHVQQQQQQHVQQQQQQQHGPARAQYDDHRRASLQEVAQDRGLVHVALPAPRYEPRRSLNDLLFAAGLPPVSPPSPPPSLSPATSPESSDEVHACEECGKRYSTSSNLARHRQTHRSHGDKKARKCPHCDKVYVSMPAFSMHVRTHNQGCACPHCGKRFSRPWLLQGHIRTHTGEKPFSCPQCGKSFADKSNLRAHIQTHSSEKPYMCGRCNKAFALKSYLYKHEESSCMRGERFRPLRRQVSAEC